MKFIVNYRNFVPIKEGLEQCGYTVLENLWNPSDTELGDCHGYLICMYDAMKRPWDTLRLKARLRSRHVPLIGWNRDAPWNKGAKLRRLWWFKKLRVLDIYCAHSPQGATEFSADPIYLPNAAWVAHYNLAGRSLAQLRDPGFYRYDVSFVGNLNAEKYPEFAARAQFFAELERRLTALGVSSWFRHAKDMAVADQVELIQRSRINLNFGAACDDGAEKSWGLPERCYGVAACGGFLLSEARTHARDDFVSGREWVDFDDIEDCVAKIRHHLAHFGEARDIAERAHARVLRDHSYKQRAQTMAAAARAWRQARLGHAGGN